jgi:thiol-disulfide isomerase/thioredoxin
MGRIAFLIFVLLCEVSAAQPAKTIKLGELQEVMTEASSSIHIINFWATWCGPCIKELPVFEKITAAGNPDIKVTLVSLDLDLDPDPQKVYRFIERKNLQSEVLLLDAPDPNSWISKIDKEWSGALPATILVNHKTGKRKFIGRALHEGELERHIEEIQ